MLYEWTFAGGKGRRVATWPANGYRAEKTTYLSEIGAQVVVDGKLAILSGPRGPQHPAIRSTVDAIVGLAAAAAG